jgi:hypothetical protein
MLGFSDYDLWKTTEPDYYGPDESCPDCGNKPDLCLCDEERDAERERQSPRTASLPIHDEDFAILRDEDIPF